MTSTSTQAGRFNLTGSANGYNNDVFGNLHNFTLDMEPCNSHQESKTFQIVLVGNQDPLDINSNVTRATVEATFDAQTANFTLSGNFYAIPFPLQNITNATNGLGSVRGAIKISFGGVVDSYRSDILVKTSHTPTWIRTVGFQNNSLNIGYGQKENSGARSALYSLSWLPLVATLMLLSGQLYL